MRSRSADVTQLQDTAIAVDATYYLQLFLEPVDVDVDNLDFVALDFLSFNGLGASELRVCGGRTQVSTLSNLCTTRILIVLHSQSYSPAMESSMCDHFSSIDFIHNLYSASSSSLVLVRAFLVFFPLAPAFWVREVYGFVLFALRRASARDDLVLSFLATGTMTA